MFKIVVKEQSKGSYKIITSIANQDIVNLIVTGNTLFDMAREGIDITVLPLNEGEPITIKSVV